MSITVKHDFIIIEDDDDDYDRKSDMNPATDEAKHEYPNPDQYCAFCLRERSLDSQFFEYRDENCSMFREYLKDMLNFELNLDYVIVCMACCKMIDLVNDFKQSCLKARNFVEQVGVGLKCEDQWFAQETVQAIESIDETIRKHTELMEPAGGDSKSEIEIEGDAISINSDEENKALFEIDKNGSDQQEFSFGIAVEADENDEILYVDSSGSTEVNSINPIIPVMNATGMKQFKEIKRYSIPGISSTCPICGAVLSNRYIQEHMFTHGEATQQCSLCPKKFKQRTNLLRHHRMKHSNIPARNLYPSSIE